MLVNDDEFEGLVREAADFLASRVQWPGLVQEALDQGGPITGLELVATAAETSRVRLPRTLVDQLVAALSEIEDVDAEAVGRLQRELAALADA